MGEVQQQFEQPPTGLWSEDHSPVCNSLANHRPSSVIRPINTFQALSENIGYFNCGHASTSTFIHPDLLTKFAHFHISCLSFGRRFKNHCLMIIQHLKWSRTGVNKTITVKGPLHFTYDKLHLLPEGLRHSSDVTHGSLKITSAHTVMALLLKS